MLRRTKAEVLTDPTPNPHPTPNPNPTPNPHPIPDPNPTQVLTDLPAKQHQLLPIDDAKVARDELRAISPVYLPYISPISPLYLP